MIIMMTNMIMMMMMIIIIIIVIIIIITVVIIIIIIIIVIIIIIIYIIISKNIRYLLWNRRFWRSLNNTYPIFLIPCIRCTNHLCDSCDLIDVNPHFIPSRLRMITNVYLLWRHRYKSRSPAIVTSQWPILPAWLRGKFLAVIWCRISEGIPRKFYRNCIKVHCKSTRIIW